LLITATTDVFEKWAEKLKIRKHLKEVLSSSSKQKITLLSINNDLSHRKKEKEQ
jgi:hypothetical protein